MVYSNELVAGGCDVKVRLLLVDEKGVGYPDVTYELRADAQRLDARPFFERQSWIRPKLTKVKIQRKVLRNWVFDFFFSILPTKKRENTKFISFNSSDVTTPTHSHKRVTVILSFTSYILKIKTKFLEINLFVRLVFH